MPVRVGGGMAFGANGHWRDAHCGSGRLCGPHKQGMMGFECAQIWTSHS